MRPNVDLMLEFCIETGCVLAKIIRMQMVLSVTMQLLKYNVNKHE